MSTNFQQLSTYLNSLTRAALPESFRSTEYTEKDFNEGMMGALTEFLRANYTTPGNYAVSYKDVNDYFKTKPGFGNKFTDSGAIKTVLGEFNVTRNPDGSYSITDTYDFNNTDEFGNPLPGGRQANMGDVFARLNPFDDRFNGFGNRIYGAARMFGGVVIPEGGDNTIPVNINIPAQGTAQSQSPTTPIAVPLPRPQRPSVSPSVGDTVDIAMPMPRPERPQQKSWSDISAMIADAAAQSLARKQGLQVADMSGMSDFGPAA